MLALVMSVAQSYGCKAIMTIITMGSNGIRIFGSSGKWGPRCRVMLLDSERCLNALAGAIVPIAISAIHKVSTAEDLSTIDKAVCVAGTGQYKFAIAGAVATVFAFAVFTFIRRASLLVVLRTVKVRGVHGRRC